MFGWVFNQTKYLKRKAQNEHLTYLALQGHSVVVIESDTYGIPSRIDLPNLKSLILDLTVVKPFLRTIHCPKVTFFGFIRWGIQSKEGTADIPHLVSHSGETRIRHQCVELLRRLGQKS